MTSSAEATVPRRTSLFDCHRALNARIIDFGGWQMPLQYKTGIIKEHKAVRAAVGIFDVSHMGEAILRGPAATETVQTLVTNDAGRLDDGGAMYTVMCYPDGGIVDDCIVYRRAQDDYLVVINASNTAKDVAWMRDIVRDRGIGDRVEVIDESEQTALIAVQGPRAVPLVDRLADADLANVPRFQFARCRVASVPCTAARTGYTGEDGFELACDADRAAQLWNALLDAGRDDGLAPVGLGARDTLRLEARLLLYGNDIDATTTPYEAGLGWVVKLGADDFVGKDALVRHKAEGPRRKLVGFRVGGRGVPRHGYPIVDRTGADGGGSDAGGGEAIIGRVTSGTTGPSVGAAIGLGYVPTERAAPGEVLTIDCRGKDVAAEIVKGPFYKRPG